MIKNQKQDGESALTGVGKARASSNVVKSFSQIKFSNNDLSL